MRKSILSDCLALAKAKLCKHKDTFKHFSFVIQDNKILGYGFNKATLYVNHVHGYPKHSKIHSEISALRRSRVLKTKRKWSMVNVRLSPMGITLKCTPCDFCFNYLKLLGCSEVWYYDEHAYMERMKL